MKSYIVKIELLDSDPLIYRRLIMPAGATYNRLHAIVQTVTNFQSKGYGDDYHFFEFDLKDIIVTNDDEVYMDHIHYMNNKEMYEERLRTIPKEYLRFEKPYQERLKIKVVKPTGLKINQHLEKNKEIQYTYDLGDDWRFVIRLEEIVEDYYFGYPTLIDGAEDAPPEDVGGLMGFYSFIDIYRDKDHPEHEKIVEWAKNQHFKEYDPDKINEILKFISYKKTQWDKINHVRYKIIEDKYRKK